MRAARRGLGPREIAKKDEQEYEEPGRDLLATRPTRPGEGGGGAGDVDNPRAGRGVPGSMGRTEDRIGSDEDNRLARGRKA